LDESSQLLDATVSKEERPMTEQKKQLRFSTFNAWWFCGLTIVAFYCNFAGVCVTVLTGASGGMFLPPWDTLLDNSPSTAGSWVSTLLTLSVPSLVLPVLLVVGWIDKTLRSDTLQRITTVLTGLLVVVLLVWGFSSSLATPGWGRLEGSKMPSKRFFRFWTMIKNMSYLKSVNRLGRIAFPTLIF
jgi:hypothetical protein